MICNSFAVNEPSIATSPFTFTEPVIVCPPLKTFDPVVAYEPETPSKADALCSTL